jgi:hypothetical protein
VSTVVSPRPCSYCGHTYANPCDGADVTCENRKHVDATEGPKQQARAIMPTGVKGK